MQPSQYIGDNSSNNSQNYYVTNIEQRPLVPTIIFKLLSYVKEFRQDDSSDFSLHQPASIKAKLQFNNVKKYIRLFSESIDDYYLLDKILKDEFLDSQKVVENIKIIFFNSCNYNIDGEIIIDDGDCCLDNMHKDIKERIVRDPEFIESHIDDLDIDKFVVALLQYGVMECQVLLNPNSYKENSDAVTG